MEQTLKTPEYTRRAIKRYQAKNPEKNKKYALDYYHKMKDDPQFIEKKKVRESLRRIKIKQIKENSSIFDSLGIVYVV